MDYLIELLALECNPLTRSLKSKNVILQRKLDTDLSMQCLYYRKLNLDLPKQLHSIVLSLKFLHVDILEPPEC